MTYKSTMLVCGMVNLCLFFLFLSYSLRQTEHLTNEPQSGVFTH